MRARPISAFGAIPREDAPAGHCPIRVRTSGEHAYVEPVTFGTSFDPLPYERCVPPQYLAGARHVVAVDDGWLVAYEGPFESQVFWTNEEGTARRSLAKGRITGFARSASGDVLAVAIGRARLGRGAVVRFERSNGHTARFVTILPIEPSGALSGDRGGLVAFGERFVFRVDEDGKLENLHYLQRDIGHVSSVARTPNGTLYLGVECGVLKIENGTESWWSAKDGASGRWPACD